MRKTVLIALGAAVALVSAAVAMAAVFTAAGVGSTTATLTSTQASNVVTRTCTGGDAKTFQVTNGRYTGLADFTTPDTALDGPLTLNAKTTVDATNPAAKLGYVEGSFRVKDDDTRVSGRFWGTLDKDGKLAGFLTGSSKGNHAKVLGTLSGTFNPATGFVGNASLGAAPSSATYAVIAGPVCKGEKPKPPKPTPKPKLVRVEGSVSAVGDGSVGSTITVMTKGPSYATCTRDATSPATAGFTAGTRVEMKCEYVGTTWTLRELKTHK